MKVWHTAASNFDFTLKKKKRDGNRINCRGGGRRDGGDLFFYIIKIWRVGALKRKLWLKKLFLKTGSDLTNLFRPSVTLGCLGDNYQSQVIHCPDAEAALD